MKHGKSIERIYDNCNKKSKQKYRIEATKTTTRALGNKRKWYAESTGWDYRKQKTEIKQELKRKNQYENKIKNKWKKGRKN